ncbi:transcriptional regulator [Salmonella enterica subsp. arizonae]|uniref:Transcriptional regulator n=1 Tax=Salmonella enterica subsp. arizonae TaxID=59203 RepID=A0A379TAC3_SALER|nr:transcriptional regulator [Salmonella enterica subsp. arizonae]
MELALRVSEALLQFNPEDPYEIRDPRVDLRAA